MLDTTEVRQETMSGFSIDNMTFHIGWPWTVHVKYLKMMTDTNSIGQTPSSLERYLVKNTIQLQSNNVCYKVSLCENIQRQSCSIAIPLSNGP